MTGWERTAWFVGEIARPYCLISSGTAVSWAIFDGKDAGVITAGGIILMALYGAKAAEVAFGAKKTADVEVAKVEAKK
jgi:hypothetical protein